MKVPRVHENPSKSDTSTFMTPGTWNFTKMNRFDFLQLSWTMKILKNQTIQFSSIFKTPGTWKSSKIRRFNFLQFSWPQVHENPQKSDNSIFFNFHDPGYMKTLQNQTIQFSSIFMTPGTWKSSKIRQFNFLQFSWFLGNYLGKMTPGTWNFTKIRCFDFPQLSWPRGYIKIYKNQKIQFSKKIRRFDFIQFSRKLKCMIFVDFHVPSFYLITQKLWLITSKTMYKHFKGQKPVPWWPKNEPIKIWAHQ